MTTDAPTGFVALLIGAPMAAGYALIVTGLAAVR